MPHSHKELMMVSRISILLFEICLIIIIEIRFKSVAGDGRENRAIVNSDFVKMGVEG
jgi:hypothetical protein